MAIISTSLKYKNKMALQADADKCVVLLLAQQPFVILRVKLIPLRANRPEESETTELLIGKDFDWLRW